MDNIRYGRLDASDDECIEAARAVHAHPFIMRLSNGYQTQINDQGSGVSAGERQLIYVCPRAAGRPAHPDS
jgi:ATP-binding cassette subfamily B protein